MLDERIKNLTHSFCVLRLNGSGYQKLILIGSRARGDYRADSDHDFVAVVDDDAPQDVLIGRNEQLLESFRQYYQQHGVKQIDLLISTKSRSEISNPEKNDIVPYACQHDGIVVWEHSNA